MADLSICFAAYNQIELLRHNLDAISSYPCDRIQVVVSDDSSTDDLEGLVSQYDDERFVYVRTPTNLGHDGNILFGMQHCSSNYVLLLRSRDNIIPRALPTILQTIGEHPNAGYFLFSALDETGAVRLQLNDEVLRCGPQTVAAQSDLLIHPSGSIYNTRYLRFHLYEQYVQAYFDTPFGFVAHQLMRADESAHADFVTSSAYGWTYANTLKAKDVAVNSTSNHTSVHDPKLVHARYICEFDFSRFERTGKLRCAYLAGVMHRYYEFLLYHLPIILHDEQYARHYRFNTQTFDLCEEIHTLHHLTSMLMEGLDNKTQETLLTVERQEVAKACTLYPAMRTARRALAACPPLGKALRFVLALPAIFAS